MKTVCLLLTSFFIAFTSYADEGRYRKTFRSENSFFELHRLTSNKWEKVKTKTGAVFMIVDEEEWALNDRLTGRKLYEVKGDFSSKSVTISNDGQYIVALDDYSPHQPSDSLKVLEFYKLGKSLTKYTLKDLLCSSQNVSHSASHFSWLAEHYITKTPNSNFVYDINSLTIHTYELVTMNFDVRTGKMSIKQLDPMINKNTIIVYGQLSYLEKDIYEIDICHRVYGKVPRNGKLKFISKHEIVTYPRDYQTILINNGYYTKTNHNLQDWILNECRFRYGINLPDNTNNENNCP